MGLWEERVVPRLVDRSLRSPEIGELRAAVCAGLHGEVLELGYGSGLNARYYPAAVSTISAVEPSDLAWRLSESRRAASRVPVVRVGLDGQRLEADDASYDAVLSTFTLCTIPDVARALAEVRRVLRTGGALHFVEHGLAPDPGVVVWQHRLEPVQRRLAGGCHLSRDIPALVRGAGLEIVELRSEYLPGPRVSRPWTFGYLGRATA
ncbi:phospholipid methyltransferase [Nocardioides szechwanensis]|uniref:Methyltransferase domain-containing protein n=1 Tax=Nocardioides szechwanensis TaxID=1005944 RepID=A0A1G9X6N0_9ACTN|nr:class I SAM-dependent methyltransferase [Nocardioides szechwanensis]GEP32410.1 phospholipid methyltransferase [Nocardioides szechwanensis]SDM92362.1 Methyltransferase domain-containing protein [Nocardioides szechwanensis]